MATCCQHAQQAFLGQARFCPSCGNSLTPSKAASSASEYACPGCLREPVYQPYLESIRPIHCPAC